jgi:hypothetical protein
MSSGSWLLRGERTLWTGRPVHARIGLADAGMALYLAIAVIVLAVFGQRWLRGEPGLFRDVAAIVWAAAALQALGMLVNLLVIAPRRRRGRVYEVTNYRIIVSGSPRLGDAASVYLDQVGEPAVRRNRNGTDDVVLRAPTGAPVSQGLARLFQSAGLGLAAVDSVTRLEGVRDAEQARLVIAEARQRMRDGGIDVYSPPGRPDGPAPAGVIIAPDEDVLWTGRPARIPWWFGGYDIYLTAFALVWVACVTGMAVWTARSGAAGFLVFLVPFGLVGGVYPAAGRVVHRRLLLRRSRYVLTSRRLITTWQPLRGTAPVVVQARLGALLPPTVRGTSVLTGLASGDGARQRNGWKELTWPATTAAPPAVIGLANAQQVAELIGAAQIAVRAAAPGSREHGRAG